jgi:large subunit ribosomal protein L33
VRLEGLQIPFSREIDSRIDGTMAKKDVRAKITLECTEARDLGMPPSRYVTTKNKRTMPGRLELKKYNPHLRRHTLHREIR